MSLHKLQYAHRRTFSLFLGEREHELSAYAFASIFIWQELYRIEWQLIDEQLCVFFRDRVGAFLFLPPLGKGKRIVAARTAGERLRRINGESGVTRIENIEAPERALFAEGGFSCSEKSGEYVCDRSCLARLTGNAYKSKRAAYNYFVKHCRAQYRPYRGSDRQECVRLFQRWMCQRRERSSDPLYRGMLEDTFSCLRVLLDGFEKLGGIGRVATADGILCAFTFGVALSPRTFCVLFEFTDLALKGAAQYIFRELCAELRAYPFINVMDDSGLENLRAVKRSYRPLRLIPAFVAYPGHGTGA